jgi:hypothetical protein
MIGSPRQLITSNPGPHEFPRFPGWQLYFGYDIISSDLLLAAKRKSDGRKLSYYENCDIDNYEDYRRALGVLFDKLGQDFLDLVPLDKS